MHHLHPALLLLRQGEEARRQRQGLLLLGLAQTMAGQIEETDFPRRLAELCQHLAASLGGATQGGIIDDGQ
ncbi:hypothetical protein D3C80_1625910 [compost metagenome]